MTLAIEPEPHCFLETTDETVDYFTDHLYTGAAATRLAKLAGLPISEAHVALRRHIGIVFDIGHQAVGFEHIPTSLQKLVDAGIPIFKLQEVAAMHIPEVTQTAVDALAQFAKTVYLSQTVQKKDGQITKFLNLEDAFAAWKSDPGPREWRTHFHVPVFLEDLGAFRTTRFALEDALRVPQGDAAVPPARDRNLHLGRAARPPQDRRHRRLRLPRDRVGQIPAGVGRQALRGWRWLDDALWDIGYALRQFRQHPGFTAIAITMLALGIGVNAAVFTLTNGILFRGTPHIDPANRIVYLQTSRGVSYPDFQDWREQARVLRWTDGRRLHWRKSNALDDQRGPREMYDATQLSANAFQVLRSETDPRTGFLAVGRDAGRRSGDDPELPPLGTSVRKRSRNHRSDRPDQQHSGIVGRRRPAHEHSNDGDRRHAA